MTKSPLILCLPEPDFSAVKASGSLVRHEVFGFEYNSWTCRPGRRVVLKRSWQQRGRLYGRIVSYERRSTLLLDIDDAFDFSARHGDIDCDVAVIMIRIESLKQRAAA